MFYTDTVKKNFRFGDIIKGFADLYPYINEPLNGNKESEYEIKVFHNNYFVIISPSCSIANKIISLTPLKKVKASFFDNPYFAKDLTNINRECSPEQAVSTEIWKKKYTEEFRQKKKQEGDSFALTDFFIYKENTIFEPYEINNKKLGKFTTNYRMIDFKEIFRVYCDKIKNPENLPFELKCLQLTPEIRNELRLKLISYFNREYLEDKIELEN